MPRTVPACNAIGIPPPKNAAPSVASMQSWRQRRGMDLATKRALVVSKGVFCCSSEMTCLHVRTLMVSHVRYLPSPIACPRASKVRFATAFRRSASNCPSCLRLNLLSKCTITHSLRTESPSVSNLWLLKPAPVCGNVYASTSRSSGIGGNPSSCLARRTRYTSVTR